MAIGDAETWINRFKTIDKRLLQRICLVWPNCLEVLTPQSDEDTITLNLVEVLWKDAKVRRFLHWIEFQFEPVGYSANGAAYSKGQIDIAAFIDRERHRYIAYECKRLNVTHNGKRSSLAIPYVKEGVMRFVTEQYAEGLPIGCMLGYVMDGDVPFALQQVHNAIKAHETEIRLAGEPNAEGALQFIERFSTNHSRPKSGTPIEVRHALLPYLADARGLI